MSSYRDAHSEEIRENNERRLFVAGCGYVGMGGMTSKQRRQFIEELNGTTE